MVQREKTQPRLTVLPSATPVESALAGLRALDSHPLAFPYRNTVALERMAIVKIAVDYRCGGSAGMVRFERTGFPFNAHLAVAHTWAENARTLRCGAAKDNARGHFRADLPTGGQCAAHRQVGREA